MKKIDIVGIAFGNFKRRKLRSVLTVLGVVIGTASIVVMMSLGIAIDKSFSDNFENMGSLNTVNVYPGWSEDGQQQTGKLDDELIEKLKLLPNVEAVSPELGLNGQVLAGRYRWNGQIMGIDMSVAEHYGFELAQGEGFTDETVATGKAFYALIGSEVPYQFRIPNKRGGGGGVVYMSGGMIGGSGGGEARPAPDVDLMSPETRLRYTFDWSYGQNNPGDTSVKKKAPLYTVKPAGILKENNDTNYNIYVDMSVAKKIKEDEAKWNKSQGYGSSNSKNSEITYDNVKVFSDTMENTTALTQAIKDMGYQAWSAGEMISTVKDSMALIQLLLGGIGGVSLLVAAIGITNTMVMSIYERTREIGIMKVIGCYLKDIRTMFLVEAGFIGLFGGLVGMVLSYGLSWLMNWLVANANMGGGGGMGMGMGMGSGTVISIIPPWLTLLAVFFATLVALISGFFPARRAMKLSALEAMRT